MGLFKRKTEEEKEMYSCIKKKNKIIDMTNDIKKYNDALIVNYNNVSKLKNKLAVINLKLNTQKNEYEEDNCPNLIPLDSIDVNIKDRITMLQEDLLKKDEMELENELIKIKENEKIDLINAQNINESIEKNNTSGIPNPNIINRQVEILLTKKREADEKVDAIIKEKPIKPRTVEELNEFDREQLLKLEEHYCRRDGIPTVKKNRAIVKKLIPLKGGKVTDCSEFKKYKDQ